MVGRSNGLPGLALLMIVSAAPAAGATLCSGLSGAALGLCNAFCSQGCAGGGGNQCDALRRNFQRVTGFSVLPCEKTISFEMVRSTAAQNAGCLGDVHGDVRVASLGPVEIMTVEVTGLPPRTEFDFFVIQVPNAPFGLAWYQGDIDTDDSGHGRQRFIGRFNIETFIVAQGSDAAPVVHVQPPFPDADSNPATEPVHTFHLGLWFNSPADAEAAGCPNTVTRFNGDHTAGIQVLSTRNFDKDQGPLRQLTP